MGLAASMGAASEIPFKPLLRSRLTVKVVVLADGDMKSTVETNLANELRKLVDVEVTQDNTAQWLLYVNVVPLIDSKGIQGYIFSTVIADQYAARTLNSLPAEDFTSPAAAETVHKLSKDQVNLRDHLVQIYPAKELSKAYPRIVNYFDETYLASIRDQIQDFNLLRTPK